MPTPLRLLLLAVAATVIVVCGGLVVNASLSSDDSGSAGSSGSSPAQASSEGSTPAPAVALKDVDTRAVSVQRRAFCDLVPSDAVAVALAGPPAEVRSYNNGESARLTQQVTDIAHEYGCAWLDAGQAARAWVFAPPVPVGEARSLVRTASGAKRCTKISGAPAYGGPSVALVCTTKQGLQASYRGLFGDAWLTCSLSGSGEDKSDLVARTEQFCAAVLQAAATE